METGLAVEGIHSPVMLTRVIELLRPALDRRPQSVRWLVDCTLGIGGHAIAALEAFPQVRLIGIDRDQQAIELAGQRLADFSGRVSFAHGVYDQLDQILDAAGVGAVDGILMDLGLSSLQIDQRQRGFSYASDAPLDMRMDQSGGLSAADLVNSLGEAELARVLLKYGDERNARRIARAIVARRAESPLSTSAQLVAVITEATSPMLRGNGHPAKRSFQALRIAVNAELDALAAALPRALARLAGGGRLVVLSYHSGEDRLVKRAFARATADRVPPRAPAVPAELAATHTLLTRGAERPAAAEVLANPRAAAARLRAVERKEAD
ncbi:MAG: 16S rRNA (cytosine(1402)-N(4))-methyltransferase RsmH [Propionibacteriaceae bacterium]|jgi:16S rRNA (cytosine1402-N4)-methyltransferase|nr:16S rRNA (cytosine(1402)-N(4))-methyltransferase RsmH [Propionibacteriaceae bacterium]